MSIFYLSQDISCSREKIFFIFRKCLLWCCCYNLHVLPKPEDYCLAQCQVLECWKNLWISPRTKIRWPFVSYFLLNNIYIILSCFEAVIYLIWSLSAVYMTDPEDEEEYKNVRRAVKEYRVAMSEYYRAVCCIFCLDYIVPHFMIALDSYLVD